MGILDDIGYVQQSRDEMEVLVTFLAERYERNSLVVTSNLVFSEWNGIFKDPMTTAAAIDRLIHHAVILELTGPSVRADVAEGALEEARTEPPASPGEGPRSSAPRMGDEDLGERVVKVPAELHLPGDAHERAVHDGHRLAALGAEHAEMIDAGKASAERGHCTRQFHERALTEPVAFVGPESETKDTKARSTVGSERSGHVERQDLGSGEPQVSVLPKVARIDLPREHDSLAADLADPLDVKT